MQSASPEWIGVVVFLCVFGGAVLGLFIGNVLPEHHVNQDSKDVVKLGMGLIGTMSALVLGLLVASAKGSYELQKSEVTEISVSSVELNRLLSHYGPEADKVRDMLHHSVELALDRIWPKNDAEETQEPAAGWQKLFSEIEELRPVNEDQRWLRDHALTLSMELAHTRWMLFQHGQSAIPLPLLVVVVLWLTVLFASFGLFAPRNSTVVATQFICALSVSTAIYMILDLGRPFRGVIQIPNTPMERALHHLGSTKD